MERRVSPATSAGRAARERRENGVGHYIKSLSMEVEEDLTLPSWRERVTVVEEGGPALRPGDRIIYYAVEDKVFFAVATVTGEQMETVPKGFFYSEEEAKTLRFYPIDLDEHANDIRNAVKLDAVELESEPQFRSILQKPGVYLNVSEDDFELLAELLTEVTEEEITDFDDEEEEEEEEGEWEEDAEDDEESAHGGADEARGVERRSVERDGVRGAHRCWRAASWDRGRDRHTSDRRCPAR